jgi:hypothetical protein
VKNINTAATAKYRNLGISPSIWAGIPILTSRLTARPCGYTPRSF